MRNRSHVSNGESKDDVLTYPFSVEGAVSVDVSYTSVAGIVFNVCHLSTMNVETVERR